MMSPFVVSKAAGRPDDLLQQVPGQRPRARLRSVSSVTEEKQTLTASFQVE
jgi:hypothetical protein